MATQRALSRAEPRTVEDARSAVDQSRARMSDTLDAIEHHIVSKKEQWTNRMDVMRPIKKQVRSRPWPALAVAVGAGILLWKLRQGKHAQAIEEKPTGRWQRLLKRR